MSPPLVVLHHKSEGIDKNGICSSVHDSYYHESGRVGVEIRQEISEVSGKRKKISGSLNPGPTD